MTVFRKVERKTVDGWEDIPFSHLKKGDLFKLYDADCEEGKIEDGSTVYIANSDAEVCPDSDGNYNGNYMISADNA